MPNGSEYWYGSTNEQVYISLNLVSTVIGSAFSILLIVLIYRMKVSNGHVLLVESMSWFQLLYDVTFFFSNIEINYTILTIANACQIIGGITKSIVSNFIAYIVFHVVYFKQSYDIYKNYNMIMAISLVPSLMTFVVFMVASVPKANESLMVVALFDMYYCIRLASIALNFVLCGMTVYVIRRMLYNKTTRTDQEQAIITLSNRMLYYPILQAISRSGNAWYELQFGVDIDQDDISTTQYACQIFLTIITPTVSVGYLIVFIIMQPLAYQHFLAMMQCRTLDMKEMELRESQKSVDNQERTTDNSVNSAYIDWTRISSYMSGYEVSDARDYDQLMNIVDRGTKGRLSGRNSAIQLHGGSNLSTRTTVSSTPPHSTTSAPGVEMSGDGRSQPIEMVRNPVLSVVREERSVDLEEAMTPSDAAHVRMMNLMKSPSRSSV